MWSLKKPPINKLVDVENRSVVAQSGGQDLGEMDEGSKVKNKKKIM